MDYNKFFTYGWVTEGPYVWDLKADKLGELILIPTEKNPFFDEGEEIRINFHKNLPINDNFIRTSAVPAIRDFVKYFSTDDFHEWCYNLWKEKTDIYGL